MKANRWHLLSLTLFLAGAWFLAGRDNIVHGVHYDYGLIFSYEWANLDWTIYFFEFQVLVFACALVARSWRLWIGFEVFVMFAVQDIFFYAWRGFVFPTGEWTWMPFYNLLGTWTTLHQIVLSILFLPCAIAIIKGVKLVERRVHFSKGKPWWFGGTV